MPIGSFTSQPLGAFMVSGIDHAMKEVLRVKCYLRYCDDTAGLARTKAEAKRALNIYNAASEKKCLCVKSSATVSPIRHKTDGTKKRRKRQRSHTRKCH